MSVLDRHICNPDLNFGTGLIHAIQTIEVHPFPDSQNVTTVTEFTCRDCGAVWRTSNDSGRTVRKWNEPSNSDEMTPREEQP